MRKLFISLGALGLAAASMTAACSSSSGDSSSGPTDSGTDTSLTDTGTPDTGPIVDSGSDTGAACQTCSDVLLNGPTSNICTTNGPPSSTQLVTDLLACACNTDGGASCLTSCANTCSAFAAPTSDCQSCIESTCGPQIGACAADGTDAGRSPTDGGDGG